MKSPNQKYCITCRKMATKAIVAKHNKTPRSRALRKAAYLRWRYSSQAKSTIKRCAARWRRSPKGKLCAKKAKRRWELLHQEKHRAGLARRRLNYKKKHPDKMKAKWIRRSQRLSRRRLKILKCDTCGKFFRRQRWDIKKREEEESGFQNACAS